MLDVELNANETFRKGFRTTVSKGKKYQISSEIVGFKGEPYCAYLAIYLLGPHGSKRRIRWLNDFSGTRKKIDLVFNATSQDLMIAYGINHETPVHSSCKYQLLPLDQISIVEANQDVPENFDDPHLVSIKKPKELSKEQESILEKNLVWIFASPRSGTTWLGTKLLSHKTFIMDEPKIGYHLRNLDALMNSEQNIPSLKKKNDYFFSSDFKGVWKSHIRKLILNRIYSQFRDITKNVVIKEPHGVQGSPIISESLPNSKIIILIRDGRDIVDSYLAGFSEGGWLAKRIGKPISPKERIPFIKRQSMIWVDVVKILVQVYNSHPKDSILLVKYENLKENTLEVLESIYTFLNIEISKNELNNLVNNFSYQNVPQELKGKGKAIRSASPGKWKENFNEEEKNAMENIMNEPLQKLGYK